MKKKKTLLLLPAIAFYVVYIILQYSFALDYKRITLDQEPRRECIKYSETIIDSYEEYQIFLDTCKFDTSNYDSDFFIDNNLAVYYHKRGKVPRRFRLGFLGFEDSNIIYYSGSRKSYLSFYYFLVEIENKELDEVEFSWSTWINLLR